MKQVLVCTLGFLMAYQADARNSLDCVDPLIGTEGTGSQYGGMMPHVLLAGTALPVLPGRLGLRRTSGEIFG